MNIIETKALIFDLDGTLVDFGEVVEKVWKMYADKYGFDFEKQVLPICHGRPAKYPLKELRPDTTEAEMEAMEEEFGAIEMKMLDGLKPIRGADLLLKTLPQGRWAIATSGTYPLASGRLVASGLPLPVHFVTAEMYTNAKPHPEPFLKAAELLKTDPSECLVFEDSPAGIEGAKKAGAKVVGINMVDEARRISRPDFIIKDMTCIRVNFSNNLFRIQFL